MRLLTFILSAGALFAQTQPTQPGTLPPPAPHPPYEATIIPVKTLTGDAFDRLLRMLGVFGVEYRGDNQMRTILVYAPKDVTEQMRHVVEQLDRPGSEAAIGRNIDLTLTLIRCGVAAQQQSASPMPGDMEPVIKQLRAITTCKDPEIWDTIPIRLQEGKDMTESTPMPGAAAEGQRTTSQIRLHPEAVYRKEQDRYVRFSTVSISFKMPFSTHLGQFNYLDFGINTSGDFREGQKTILGKTSAAGDESIFAVISLKVLD